MVQRLFRISLVYVVKLQRLSEGLDVADRSTLKREVPLNSAKPLFPFPFLSPSIWRSQAVQSSRYVLSDSLNFSIC